MKPFLLTLIVLFITIIGKSQNIEFEEKNFPNKESEFKLISKDLKQANLLFENGKTFCKYNLEETYCEEANAFFQEALPLFLNANSFNNKNALVNYRIGICYFVNGNMNDAYNYFKISEQLNSETDEYFDYYYAQALHINNEWKNAIAFYNKAKNFFLSEDMEDKYIKSVISFINKQIASCESALILKDSIDKNIIISNMGSNVNSKNDDYGAISIANNSIILFSTNIINSIDSVENRLVDIELATRKNIYFSINKEGQWTQSQELPYPLNTPNKNSVICAKNSQGNKVLINKNGDIYESEFYDDKWSEPLLIEGDLNTIQDESTISFSDDLKKLFFTSDRKGGYGGYDIYIAHLDDQFNCIKVENAGNLINTEFDEEGVFYHSSSKTLYFSSKGHNTIGGYDIFKTYVSDSITFSKPVNLGLPLNSSADDIYFSLNETQTKGYLTSFREENYGKRDIYMFENKNNLKQKELNNNTSVQTKGKINVSDSIITSEKKIDVTITTTDSQTNKPVESIISVIDKNDIFYINKKSTNSNGILRTELSSDFHYKFIISSKGYNTNEFISFIPSDSKTLDIDISLNEKVKLNLSIDSVSNFQDKSIGNLSIIEGHVFDYLDKSNVSAYIDVIDYDTDSLISKTKTDSKTGKFSVKVPSGRNYKVNASANGYIISSGKIITTNNDDYFKIENSLLNEDALLIKETITDDLFKVESYKTAIFNGNLIDDLTHSYIRSTIEIIDNNYETIFIPVDSSGYFTYKLPINKQFLIKISPKNEDYYLIIDSISLDRQDVIYSINPEFREKSKPYIEINIGIINYATNEYQLIDTLKINDIINTLTSRKILKYYIQINGHTDSEGDEIYNMKLSKLRAESLANYLINKKVISKDKIKISAFGESKPLNSNLSEEEKALNRRVEIFLYEPSKSENSKSDLEY